MESGIRHNAYLNYEPDTLPYACAKHFLILGCYYRSFMKFDFEEGVMLAVEL